MTKAEARTRIAMLCKASETPVLSSDELDYLADYAANRSGGSAPSATSASYTNDPLVFRAVAHGWEMKKAGAAGMVDMQSGNQKISRSQYFDHCDSMILLYTKKSKGALGQGSVRIGQMDAPKVSKLSNE